MQVLTLLAPTTMGAAITGSSVSYDPLIDSVGCAFIEIKQTASSPVPAVVSSIIDIQGSVDGSDWVSLYQTNAQSLVRPTGVGADVGGALGGYRTQAQVIQCLPFMRVCTSAALTNGASASLSVFVVNG
jgi:hypothetical protein